MDYELEERRQYSLFKMDAIIRHVTMCVDDAWEAVTNAKPDTVDVARSERNPKNMLVPELRHELERRGLDTTGRSKVLKARLEEDIRNDTRNWCNARLEERAEVKSYRRLRMEHSCDDHLLDELKFLRTKIANTNGGRYLP